MNSIIAVSVALMATAAWGARLDNGYLPPRGSSGAGAGLVSPPRGFGGAPGAPGYGGASGGGGFGGAAGGAGFGGAAGGAGFGGAPGYQQPSGPVIPIVSYSNNPNQGDGSYSYSYESGNGIKAQESGKGGPGAEQGTQAAGGFSYTGDDGQTYSITYTADEGGFRPQGAHIPTPPPIPKEILDSLALQGITVNPDGSYSGGNPNDSGLYNPSGPSGGGAGGSYNRPAQSYGPPAGAAPAYRPAPSGSFSPSSGYNY